MSPEEIEQLRPYLYLLAIIPGLLILRFLIFMLTPKFILKKFFTGGQGLKTKDGRNAIKAKRREDDSKKR